MRAVIYLFDICIHLAIIVPFLMNEKEKYFFGGRRATFLAGRVIITNDDDDPFITPSTAAVDDHRASFFMSEGFWGEVGGHKSQDEKLPPTRPGRQTFIQEARAPASFIQAAPGPSGASQHTPT